MQFNKLSFKALILTLAGITSSMAAGMAPLTFGTTSTDADNWNYLVNYRLWSQTAISFGDHCNFTNNAGWIGTATGNLFSTGNDAQIAGAVIVGGSVRNTNGMKLTTGPIRYGGSISSTPNGDVTLCQGTTTAGACADVPQYKNIPVPYISSGSWPSNLSNLTTPDNGTYRLDAQGEVTDFYFNKINVNNDSRLIILMPAGGRVTRIFTKSLTLGVHPEILVQYEGERLPRCSQSSSTCSGEYEGNLLIFVDEDIYFRNTDNSTIEGTIISTETIAVESNMNFAGQLIAKEIMIGNQIKGDGFQFVPFNELPALTLSNKNATFLENNTWQTIKIGLDNESETDVTFKYCFEFNDQAVAGLYAGTSDVAPADASHDFPVCGTSGAPLTATIPKGKLYPSKDINIKPLIDGLVETSSSGGEKLWLVISDVQGAKVSTDNYDESRGGFNIFITDVDKLPSVSSPLVINVNEDAEHTFTKAEFNFSHATQTFTSVIISGLPTAGTLTYNGTAVSRDQVIDVANLGKLTYQPKANDFGDNYATFKYKVVGDGTSSNISIEYTATVNVVPVNDKPTVADVTFTVSDRSHSVSGGPITVTDVSNEISVDTYTYTLDATSADYSAFNSTFEIVPLSNGKKARIAVKTGAVIDYSQKKEYVVQATVTDNASTETSKVAGALTSNKFTITVKIEEEPETISPLTFGNANTDVDNWKYLVNYKMWGQDEVSFGNNNRILNEAGWIGSANGNLTSSGNDAQIAGAVIVGGSIQNTGKMMLTTGPVRYGGSITDASRVSGTKCQGTTTAGDCADVPLYREKLTVPKMTSWPSNLSNLTTPDNGTYRLDAQGEVTDFYFNKINISNDSRLIIKMPKGGRVTRIFTKSLTLGVHPHILVQYEGESTPRCNTKVSNYTCGGDYEGNLLIFVDDDITFRNSDYLPIDGTIISTGTISIINDIAFAGQLIAYNVIIGNEVRGDGFQFVPFTDGSNTTDPELPTVTKELVINVNEDASHAFTKAEFNFSHATQTFSSVIISGLPTAGTLTYDGTAVSKGQKIAVADLGKLAYQPKANDFGDNYATFKYKVVGSGTSDNTSIEYTATVNVAPVNDKPTVADVTFTIGEQSLTVSGGPIEVTDVSNEREKDTYTYTLVNVTGSDYTDFNSTFEIVPSDNGKTATIKVKTGAVLDYNQKSEYVVYATVTDDAATETSVEAGPLTSAQFKITVKISDEPEIIVQKSKILPLTFGSSNGTDENDNWNYLLNYKIWGQTGVSFGNNNSFPNAEGWVGAASGSLTSTGNDAKIAGAVIVGGSIQNTGKMALTTGPVRYGGSISDGSRVSGTKCQGTTTAGDCADVPQYKNIPVPYISSSSWPSNLGNLTTPTGGTYMFNAQTESADFYFNSINISDDSRLIIKMPKGGRVTRIFTKSLNLDNHPHILVQYEGEQYPRCNTKVSNYTCGGDYEGNLLIFVDGDIAFRNADYTPIDGTIISTGTISIISNMAFAGQLIANNITIGGEVKGDGFQFVPFKELPALTLSNKNATFPESDKWETIKISLDNVSETDVTFKYCFEFNNQAVSGLYASTSDVAPADASHDFPVCGTSGAPLTATIPKGQIYPSKDINIKPLIDGLIETSSSGGEKLWLVISDVQGANVSTDNYDESRGGFNIFITDVDKQPTVSSELVIKMNEDSEHKFTSSEFNFVHSTRTFASVIISGLPTAGTLTYDGTAISKDQVIDVADLGKFAYQPKANEFGNNYATFKYKVVGSGTGDNTSMEYTATINVIPVNDKPTVADATFTVNELDHSVTGGPIEVTDVSKERSKDTYTYTLVNVTGSDYTDFNSTFEIVKQSDQNATIKVKTGAVIDYTQKKEYVVYATVKDNASTETSVVEGPLTSEQFKITVKIQNENDNPVINDQTFTIAEKNTDGTDWPSGKTIGKVSASDPDGDELSFTVVTTDVPFKFNNSTKELVVTDGSVLDFETKTAWTFTVKVEDGQGGNATAQITVNIEDVQEPEIYVNNEGATVISGNASAGTVIENITDNNDEDTQAQLNEITSAITYAVSEGTTANATEYFDIDEHGTITAKEELVFEALYTGEDNPGNEFTFIITASGTNSKDEPVSTNITKKIIVADVNEEPVIKTEEPIDVPETALSNGEIVGKIDAIDPDSCSFNPNYACREGTHPQGFNKLTYTIDEILEVDGSSDFPFEIDPNTGVITFRQGPSLIRQYRYNYNTAIVRRVNEPNNTRQRRYEFIVKVTDGSTDPRNPPKSVKKKIVINITETAHISSSSSSTSTSSSSEVSSSSVIVSSSSSAETITSSGSVKPASSSATVASSSANIPASSSATIASSSTNKPESSSATVVSSSANKPESSSATVASSSANKPESSSATVASSSSNKPESSSAMVVSSSANKPESSSATVASSSSNKPESSSATVTSSSSNKPASSSATVASSSANMPESSSSNKEVKSSSSITVSSNSAGKKSSSSVSKPNSSSSGIAPNSSSSRKTSSSSKTQSSSSSKETGTDKSSSSHKPNSSASSSNSNNDGYDTPTFYVRMTGAFEFEIVMDESLPSIAKQYAVMDMKGQVICIGELNNKNAHVKVPTSGAYIVRIGLGYRRVNVR